MTRISKLAGCLLLLLGALLLDVPSGVAAAAGSPPLVADEDPVFVDEAPSAPAPVRPSAPPARALSLPQLLVAGTWTPQGPGPSQGGQVENITDLLVSGAIHTVAAHPTDADTLYIGTVNGGVWKTTNATAASPTWAPVTDTNSSLSIGALEFDPTDGTSNTLLAGTGRFSSFAQRGGSRAGLLRTTNGGSSWTELTGGGTLVGKNISGVAARGATLVASVNVADSFTCGNIGIFRSTDTGATFGQVSLGSGLPRGVNHDLAGDPSSASTLYTTVVFADTCDSVANGIFKSTDTGATWTRVSDAAIEALMASSGASATANVEIAVGSSNNVYVAILNNSPIGIQLGGIFRSGNGGTSWTQMDTPKTNENGTDVGINPIRLQPGDASPGGQGNIHFSIVADPLDADVVYVGGDRQPSQLDGGGEETGVFPNSIGAFNYAGRLFRGDASQPSGSQWVHLTHSDSAGPSGGGTASSSAPHADSREMVFDANGDIVETDDGGIFRRTSPTDDTGDWLSVNGTLQVTEIHDIAWDARSDVLIGGHQDNGTSEQISTGSATWRNVSGGDGGDVAVDDTSLAGQSVRYSSSQNLGGFRRRVYDTSNVLQSQTFPALTVTGSGASFVPLFVTPVALNNVDQTRMIIVGKNSIYESLDGGDTITEIGPGQGPGASVSQNAVAYGSRQSGVDKPKVLYVGVNADVLVRPATGGALTASLGYVLAGGGTVRDVVVDPSDWKHAFAADDNQVFETTDAGASWTDVTGNLGSLGAVDFRALAYLPNGANDRIVLGARGKVFIAFQSDFTVWDQLGTGLPNTPVWDLEYDPADNVLVAGTLGRSAWKLASVNPPPPAPTCAAAPISGCQVPAESQKAQLLLKQNLASPAKDQLDWKWLKGSVTPKASFGDPLTTTYGTVYQLCIYDGGSNILVDATIPAGGTCGSPPKPCWKENTKGFNYKNKSLTPDGIEQLKLKEGLAPGKATILLKGKGALLDDPVIPVVQPITVQLVSSDGVCWEATYSAPAAKNTALPAPLFKDKAD